MDKVIHIAVHLDTKTFRKFARFNSLKLQKRWRRPVIFALILIAFSMVALFSGREEAGLISSVLLMVGIGLPLVYFGTFFSQVNTQAALQKLEKKPLVYYLAMDDSEVRIRNARKKEDDVHLPWTELYKAWRVKGCVYLYATPQKAFLIPDSCADVSDDELWIFISEKMDAAVDLTK